jgi:hypothetical protein
VFELPCLDTEPDFSLGAELLCGASTRFCDLFGVGFETDWLRESVFRLFDLTWVAALFCVDEDWLLETELP